MAAMAAAAAVVVEALLVAVAAAMAATPAPITATTPAAMDSTAVAAAIVMTLELDLCRMRPNRKCGICFTVLPNVIFITTNYCCMHSHPYQQTCVYVSSFMIKSHDFISSYLHICVYLLRLSGAAPVLFLKIKFYMHKIVSSSNVKERYRQGGLD